MTRTATSIVAAAPHRRRGRPAPDGAPSGGRCRCLRLEQGVATVTSLMSAPGFSRDQPIAPRNPAPPPGLGPRAVLSLESSRLPFFDGSTHKASPPANWFNSYAPVGRGRRAVDRIARESRRWRHCEWQAGRAEARSTAREPVAAERKRRRWICATPRRARAPLLYCMRSIMALPNPEQLTCVDPGIRRAKS